MLGGLPTALPAFPTDRKKSYDKSECNSNFFTRSD
jgi:hypothetical protein